MRKYIPFSRRIILASFILANFIIAPVISNPQHFISWQPGYFEIGILNTQDDAVGAHGQKMLNIPPTDGIFNETKGYSKAGVGLDLIPVGVLSITALFFDLTTINPQIFCNPIFQIHPSQPQLCTFLI